MNGCRKIAHSTTFCLGWSQTDSLLLAHATGGSTYVQHRKLAVNNFWKDLYMKQKLKTIGTFLIYLAMFILICIFFIGHGTFIYEAF